MSCVTSALSRNFLTNVFSYEKETMRLMAEIASSVKALSSRLASSFMKDAVFDNLPRHMNKMVTTGKYGRQMHVNTGAL